METRGLIAVDIGNSTTKLGWFSWPLDSGFPQPQQTADYPTDQTPPDAIVQRLAAEPLVWEIASVHRDGSRRLKAWIDAHRPHDDVRLLSYSDLPLAVEVEFPERVGLDRLAAAVAVNLLRTPDRAAIVVDAGTAITVDLVSAAGAFQGGAILPGFRMQAEALFGGADQLPYTLLEPTADPPAALGKNTEQAIRSGLFWGAVGAVRELLGELTKQCSDPPQVFVTGGDLRKLAAALGPTAEFVPNMVLAGVAISAQRRLA